MADEARCVYHPEQPATALCTRCGTFICDQDRRMVQGVLVCEECSRLPGVDPVEDYRLRHFGKPDLWAWVMGLSALPQLWAGVDAWRAQQARWWVGVNLALVALDVCYFLGQRWTRPAILLSVFPVMVAPLPPDDPTLPGFVAGVRIATAAVWLIALVFMWFDPRNQLFFRLDVPRPKLERAYAAYAENRIAKVALGFGAGGLFVPGLGVVGIPMAVTAVLRAQSGKVRNRGLAIASLVVCVATSLFWVLAILALMALAEGLS